jgi:micrococcal nuclease
MSRALNCAFAIVFLLCFGAASAQEIGRVIEIIDGDTLLLADRREVRLVGIQAPKLPLGRRNFTPWPLAEESRAALVRLAGGKTLKLSYGGATTDRHGRVLAHLTDESGRFIQAEMLRQGMARLYSFADNRARLDELFAAEREARAANRGIWALPYYKIRTPDTIGGDLDSFQLVAGRVLRASAVGGRIYLNFGGDPKTDFTAVIQPGNVKSFAAVGLDPLALSGRQIRVRGWIENHNGPLIRVTHPEQIEVLQ